MTLTLPNGSDNMIIKDYHLVVFTKGGAEVNALKKYRLEKGLTQKEVAFQVGITEMSYQRYERGQRFPDIRTAIRIGEILGIDNVNELWSGSSMVN